MRIYKHLDPDKFDAHPSCSTRARISAADDVRDWVIRTRQNISPEKTVTVTFIIDTDNLLWIADRHSEHIACADGRDLLSAGEMTFEITLTAVNILEVTNQSLGYCPESDSWSAVALALESTDINYPGYFTTEFIFRICSDCHTKNIVKDNWYECGVCGSTLSSRWNF